MQHILPAIILSRPVCLAICDLMGPLSGDAIEGRSIAATEDWSVSVASEVITLKIYPEETAFAGAALFQLEPR